LYSYKTKKKQQTPKLLNINVIKFALAVILRIKELTSEWFTFNECRLEAKQINSVFHELVFYKNKKKHNSWLIFDIFISTLH
jgi:hypothetical protein